jgi:hypothetical protein
VTFREPYEAPFTPSYRWRYAPEGWAKTSTSSVTPFRRHMLKLQAEAVVKGVPLAVVYHGQVRGDAHPETEETSERRVLEEGRQMSRWADNTGKYQRGGKANRGTTFAAERMRT